MRRPFHTRHASFWLIGFKLKAPRTPRKSSIKLYIPHRKGIFHQEHGIAFPAVLTYIHTHKKEFAVLAFKPPSCFFSRTRVWPPVSPTGLKFKPPANNMKHTMLKLLTAMDKLPFITTETVYSCGDSSSPLNNRTVVGLVLLPFLVETAAELKSTKAKQP